MHPAEPFCRRYRPMVMLRGLRVPITVAVAAATLAACGSGPARQTSQPAATRTVSSVGPSSAPPTATGSPPSPPGSPRPAGTPATGASPGGRSGTGIDGKTVLVSCPVDRGDPPCPATPVQARIEVLNATTQTLVTTVDTDPQGTFTVSAPVGAYVLRAIRVGTTPARRPLSVPVTVTAGHYTTITMRLDNGLR